MMVAVIAQIVTMVRRRPGTATGAAAEFGMAGQSSFAATAGEPNKLASERRCLVSMVILVEIDPHRHALHHLDEIAGGVLRRQDRELRAGAG
jgi:hypothetical protein